MSSSSIPFMSGTPGPSLVIKTPVPFTPILRGQVNAPDSPLLTSDEFNLLFLVPGLIIILGATDTRAPKGFAPIAIGLGLTLIHLIGIPVTNLSVNPARSTGPYSWADGRSNSFGCSGWRRS